MALPVPGRFRPLVLGTLLVGAIILAFGWLQDDEDGVQDNGAVIGYVIVVLLAIVVAYLLWRFVVSPRAGVSGTANLALALGALSLLLGFVYWTGIIYGFGPAAIGLALLAREHAGSDNKPTIALVLAGLGLAIGIIGGAVDSIL